MMSHFVTQEEKFEPDSLRVAKKTHSLSPLQLTPVSCVTLMSRAIFRQFSVQITSFHPGQFG